MVQTNVAPSAFRTSTIIPQYVTKFAMDQVCDQPGLNVTTTVWQLRCDKFVVFSAKQLCSMRLEIPRCEEGPEMKRAILSQGEVAHQQLPRRLEDPRIGA